MLHCDGCGRGGSLGLLSVLLVDLSNMNGEFKMRLSVLLYAGMRMRTCCCWAPAGMRSLRHSAGYGQGCCSKSWVAHYCKQHRDPELAIGSDESWKKRSGGTQA